MRLVDIDRVPVADELQEFANPCVVQLPRWAIEEIVRTCSAFPNNFPCVEGRGGNGERRKKMTNDLISREAAKNKKVYSEERHEYVIPVAEIDWLPSAQPEIEPVDIDYYYCSKAMLKMWIDNVLTDGEYNRIMDKLNDFEQKRRERENE